MLDVKTEAFDNPHKLDYDDEIEGFDQSMYVQLPDKTYLHITFNNEGNNQWVVEFYRDHTQELTGQGDAQRIFATVIDAIQKFIKKEKPASIDFSADKMVEPGQNAESRAKLYNSLVKRYASALGYDSKINDQGDHVTYTLKRRKDVAENFKDGKKPGRKGLANRSGVDVQKYNRFTQNSKKQFRERQRMAHWCANMNPVLCIPPRVLFPENDVVDLLNIVDEETAKLTDLTCPPYINSPHNFIKLNNMAP